MAIDSLTYVPNFLFSDVCLSLLFNFKIRPLLGLSCLISSMVVIILIISIIKTTCLGNIILMVELEGKLPWSRWSLYTHNLPNPGYFHKIFGMHLKKVRSTSTLKNLFHRCYIFGFINHPFNGQIISLIGAQAHL